jgi:hypothetical protein
VLTAPAPTPNNRPLLFAAAAAVIAAGCITTEGDVHPRLYTTPARPAAEVATLFGPIATVDGQDVSSRGSSFELLPGCHVVTLLKKVGDINPTVGGWSATLPNYVFAFRMRPAHAYVIEYHLQDGSGSTGQLAMKVEERAPQGQGPASPLGPATDPADFEACRTWAQQNGYNQ